ncbi:MAG TPA: RagB/SusD family nutrient uptake outer membrane protein [Cyclobacteriaceae bacterium]|nr:RagB/SusD family nutrient uptake outer membrane protein [Cyclobacteriaceae bacterium]MCB9237148.1 RagB/SusD family nutrient uptake outer membrane protein [Flammeovirgaceae bacterium]MCB0500123.1 RagB/SusD family nutrient uptake outer membrane protein [Cyclobacteriaceae bacterium]MCO5270857.1 RagB/SusD family nutrient uptake outer membrane protein [Cyclobacteriaceae bacterium]MCW5901857.1 RagB/SusD family nutrient uptake outer membrane protein [Cyclobacteriaceae bacterium]
MKKFRNKITVAVLTMVMLSCSDNFLELQPQQSVADTQALTTLEDFKSAITGVYNDLSNSDYYGRYFILIPDVMSDDVKQNSQANRVRNYAEYVATRADDDAEDIWEVMYEANVAANAIINSEVEVPAAVQADKDHIVGEAYALRGLIYFDMVRLFAQSYQFTADASHLGVPIVLKFDQLSTPARNTVAEVYAQVISDMQKALTLMKDTPRSGNTATLSATAVKALLARVYLYKADWANAEAMATEVINSGKYSLVSNANYVSSWSSDYSSESIFEISMTPSDNRGSDALGRMYIVEGYGDYLPSDDVYSLIPAGDARQGLYKPDPGLSGAFAPFRMNKYPSVKGEDNTKVIRLSEMYLIRAEARAMKSSPDEPGARADVNEIRLRGLPTATPIASSGPALLDDIARERRIELAFEGQRLWDLMRKKQGVVRNQCTSPICSIPYPNDRFVLPIPQAEIDANPVIQPNPGY